MIGAAIEVHRELGPGFLESVYEEALCVALSQRGIPFERQVPVQVVFSGVTLNTEHRLDLLVDKLLVIELKAAIEITPLFEAITKSYLKATRSHLGLLINFNVVVLKEGIRRIILTPDEAS